MQPKQIIAIYDEVGAPVGASEVKTFSSRLEYETFIKTCKLNKEKMLKRKNDEIERLKAENDNKDKLIDRLQKIVAYLVYEDNVGTGVYPNDEKGNGLLDKVLNDNISIESTPTPFIELLKNIKGESK